MSNCLNCGLEVPQIAGRRPRIFCNNNNKCKGEYNRKQNKQQKYVHLKSFQELKERFDAVVLERDELKVSLKTAKQLISGNGWDWNEKTISDGIELPKDYVRFKNIVVVGENKPIAAPKKENTPKRTPTTKRGDPVAENEANKALGEALSNSKSELLPPKGLKGLELSLWKAEQKEKNNNP